MVKETVVRWSPGVTWQTDENGLQIMGLRFDKEYSVFFPKFYQVTASGNTIGKICNTFKEQNILPFIHKLLELHILVNNIQGIEELFFVQGQLYSLNHSYDEAIRYDAGVQKKYVAAQQERNYYAGQKGFKLAENLQLPDEFIKRRSVREFSGVQVPYSMFSNLMKLASCDKAENKYQFYYPSAGALYPVDIYLYVKEDRVENIKGGFYYFNPVESQIYQLSTAKMTKESHYFLNKEIFETSAFSVFYVYSATSSVPKYDGMGYFYALLDAGVLMGALSSHAHLLGLGSCIIGDMDHQMIEPFLSLNADQRFICAHEFGVRVQEGV